MQKQTIKRVIEKKITEWIESITDTQLRYDLKRDILVSGGAIASMFLNIDVNDYDIYIQDRKTLMSLVLYYTKKYPSELMIMDGHLKNTYIQDYNNRGGNIKEDQNSYSVAVRTLKDDQIKIFIQGGGGGFKTNYVDCDQQLFVADRDGNAIKGETIEKQKYQPVFFSPNAISLSDDIQIVSRFFGSPEEIHKTFDFIHATNYFTFSKGVVTNLLAMESLISKQLIYQGSLYPVTSIIRAKKFVKRQWNINAGEMMKMIFQCSLLDLTNFDILEEQLIGVDVAYFGMLIETLRSHKEAHPEFVITPEYFNSIIDKLFRDLE